MVLFVSLVGMNRVSYVNRARRDCLPVPYP